MLLIITGSPNLVFHGIIKVLMTHDVKTDIVPTWHSSYKQEPLVKNTNTSLFVIDFPKTSRAADLSSFSS